MMILVLFISIFVVLLATLYLYSKYSHRYWERMGIKTPPFKFLTGHAHYNFTSTYPIWEFRDQAYHKYGAKEGISGTYNFFTPSAIVGNPDILKKILVSDFECFVDRRHLQLDPGKDPVLNDILTNAEGENWKRLRNAVTPVFTSGRLKGMFPLMEEKADKLIEKAESLSEESKQPIEFKKFVGLYLLDAIASCGFGLESNCIDNPDDEFATKAAQIFKDHSLISQVVVFLLGGFDASGSAIAFTAYYLAVNLHVQRRVRDEIQTLVEAEGDGQVTYDVLAKAKYLDSCLSETLRLYPAETSFNRQCTQDYEIPELGVTIPKGMILEIPVWSLHRDPAIWPDPCSYDPERFSSEEKLSRPSYTYLPFGVGQRSCIGMRFALLSAKLALAKLLLTFDLTCADRQEHPPKLACSPLVLRPETGIYLHLSKIDQESEPK